nr:hypothetical protein CFP56_21210 [Quercus suber]
MASAFEEKLLAAEQTNLKAAKYWGVGIAGLIGIFIIEHWIGRLLRRNVSKANSSGKAISTVSAPFNRFLLGTTVGRILVLPGRIWLALAYLAINIACAFTNVNWAMAELFFAKRMGWMTVCNLCLVIFLGMKNTPLSPLAGRSYESLNVLHQFAGYTTILCMVLHST